MAKVILYISATLDGFISREDGSVDFLDRFNESGDDFGFGEFSKSIGVVVMGNETFTQFSGHAHFYEAYKGKELFVFSRQVKEKHDR